jgi:hypothetical protein
VSALVVTIEALMGAGAYLRRSPQLSGCTPIQPSPIEAEGFNRRAPYDGSSAAGVVVTAVSGASTGVIQRPNLGFSQASMSSTSS